MPLPTFQKRVGTLRIIMIRDPAHPERLIRFAEDLSKTQTNLMPVFLEFQPERLKGWILSSDCYLKSPGRHLSTQGFHPLRSLQVPLEYLWGSLRATMACCKHARMEKEMGILTSTRVHRSMRVQEEFLMSWGCKAPPWRWIPRVPRRSLQFI